MPPPVYMSDDEDEMLEQMDDELKDTEEYKELMNLLQLKQQQEQMKKNEHALSTDGRNDNVVHEGIRCNSCGKDPIIGIRWKCSTCQNHQTDLCSTCMEKGNFETDSHKRDHILHPMEKVEVSYYLDYHHEWVSKEPNYLDPSFMST
jgi:hypothetical protein